MVCPVHSLVRSTLTNLYRVGNNHLGAINLLNVYETSICNWAKYGWSKGYLFKCKSENTTNYKALWPQLRAGRVQLSCLKWHSWCEFTRLSKLSGQEIHQGRIATCLPHLQSSWYRRWCPIISPNCHILYLTSYKILNHLPQSILIISHQYHWGLSIQALVLLVVCYI